MNTDDIISFFDERAAHWDSMQERKDEVVEKILDSGGICAGIHVLDVACGTGILFPDYKRRDVASVTGIDISPEMVKIAKDKFKDFKVICADAEKHAFEKQYDAVMIYNAFPHFTEPEKLVENLAKATKRGGRLSVAHGMSKSELDKFHAENAGKISKLLPEKEEVASMLTAYFNVDVLISDESMYMVSGVRK